MTDDLRPRGYAPGGYVFTCGDCPENQNILDRPKGDRRSWRCEDHARAARDAQAAAHMMPDMSAFQERIKVTRKARNMSLEDLAGASGFTKSHVWELESGRSRNPTVRAVWGLSSALGVTPSWLLGLDADSSPIDPLALEVAALIERRISERIARD